MALSASKQFTTNKEGRHLTIQFRQRTGEISIDGLVLGQYPLCYSGHGAGLDNPVMEAAHNFGVIPAGGWKIVEWLDHYEAKGPQVARLSPVGHDAHGRSGFLIHGDNQEMNHTASEGCIIAPRAVRDRLRESGETELEVVA